ncbi:MAG: relaxase/mobilization nuclease domain-containing protein [Candidatus Thiodiazotropha sp. (ex Dulcina madagascariensis)]|nr:relaxase/mobilization nuclease domain-containing protein [Candidatus Thiodiazotropha sp. (ex Dulcina madagascariensis)]
MIAKHVPMRSLGKSDFAGLVRYISNKQGKTERLGNVQAINCQADTMPAVIAEVLATQRLNTRAEGDKTYHLLVSFRPGEKPDADTLRTIEERICAGLGYGDHQRVSAVHHDTDNLHIHIAINKIHPTRHTMHEPYQSYRTLGDLCQAVERDYGLERENHQSKRTIAEGRAADMEQHAGIESLVSWIKRECLDEIRGAPSWAELHQVMRDNGLALRLRANGFVIKAGDGTMVKASTVARDLSKPKLEAWLGVFEPSDEQVERVQARKEYKKRPMRSRIDTVELYAKYQEEQLALTATRGEAWEKAKGRKARLIEAAKRSNKLRRSAIKLMGGTRFAKKLLYAQAHKALRDEIQSINKQYQKERTSLFERHKRQTWADWLKQQALNGDGQALVALRAREAAQGLKGDTIKGDGGGLPGHTPVTDNITKKGTIILRAGATAVRDDGEKVQVSRQATSQAVEEALRMAAARYGKRITVTGTAEFKAQAILSAVSAELPIIFSDAGLERRRQTLLSSYQEKQHDRSERSRSVRGRADRHGAGRIRPGTASHQHAAGTGRAGNGGYPGVRAGAVTVVQATFAKPDIGRIGRVPPPEGRNRLRTLSGLGVVRISGGGEVLLPRDVSRGVEQSGAESDTALRRGVSGPGARVTAEHRAAVNSYISERESKHLKGFDIPKHFRYNGENGEFAHAGIRTVDGHSLALLKRDDQVFVLPIDGATAKRLKRAKIGDPVTVDGKGFVKRKPKGRSL